MPSISRSVLYAAIAALIVGAVARTQASLHLLLLGFALLIRLLLAGLRALLRIALPALLRLVVRPEGDGISVDIVKRRGPTRAEPVSSPLQPSPILFSRHARISRRQTAPTRAGSVSAEVVA